MFNDEDVQKNLNAIIEHPGHPTHPRFFWISLRTIENDSAKPQQDGFQVFSMGFKEPVEETDASDSFGSLFDDYEDSFDL